MMKEIELTKTEIYNINQIKSNSARTLAGSRQDDDNQKNRAIRNGYRSAIASTHHEQNTGLSINASNVVPIRRGR